MCLRRGEITVFSTLLTLSVLAGFVSYVYSLPTWKAPGTAAPSEISSRASCLSVP